MSEALPVAGLILAAGKGTRMKSDLPKALHEVCGLPMVEHVGRALRQAGVERPVIVIGHGADRMRGRLADGPYDFCLQTEQLGTGHAALMARDLLGEFPGVVLVCSGDTPLLRSETLQALVRRHVESGAVTTLATLELVDPTGYGRVLRNPDGSVAGIVEHKDATPDQRAIREINPAVYCFDARTLYRLLPTLRNANAQGEYYLTDVIAAVRSEGGRVEAMVFDDPDQFLGVNDRWQLAEAARVMRWQILRRHAEFGVTIVDPASTYIGVDVEIAPDVTIQPMTVLEGRTRIGEGSAIGPSTWMKDAVVGRSCRVFMSHVDQATLMDGSRCGPFSNLRPGALLRESVKIGNFVEVKNAEIGAETSVSHLTYIGDARVGAGANIGAGTITCNYDGFAKHRTEIGDGAFVGSNVTLVAPVRIGAGAMVAAGSVVTSDVPDDALALGRARQENKEQWAKSWRNKKQRSDA